MKKLLILSFLLLSFQALAVAPKISSIERGLPLQLNDVSRVEVKHLKRIYFYYLACTLHPDICFDGIKDYEVELRVKTDRHGDLDFDCSLDQYTRKKELVIRLCAPVGHKTEFKSLMKVKNNVVILKD